MCERVIGHECEREAERPCDVYMHVYVYLAILKERYGTQQPI